MENLSSFYQSKGQALPSVQQRQGVASQAGIQNYSGTAQQNTQLLNFLKTQQTPQAQQQNAVPVSSNIPANIIGTQQVQIPQAQPIQVQPVENIASTLIEQTKTEATPLQGTRENLISKILENQLGVQGEKYSGQTGITYNETLITYNQTAYTYRGKLGTVWTEQPKS